jgi:hypothetical protein
MTLKTQIAADMAIFLNTDDFADMHNVDGNQVAAVIDEDIIKQRSNRQSGNFDGVFRGEVMLYVKAADLPRRPVRGQAIRLDGRLMLVDDCAESDGMLEISLEANES